MNEPAFPCMPFTPSLFAFWCFLLAWTGSSFVPPSKQPGSRGHHAPSPPPLFPNFDHSVCARLPFFLRGLQGTFTRVRSPLSHCMGGGVGTTGVIDIGLIAYIHTYIDIGLIAQKTLNEGAGGEINGGHPTRLDAANPPPPPPCPRGPPTWVGRTSLVARRRRGWPWGGASSRVRLSGGRLAASMKNRLDAARSGGGAQPRPPP